MRSRCLTHLSLGVLALCLCLERAADVNAQRALTRDVFRGEPRSKAASIQTVGFDAERSDQQQSGDEVFESFEQAFRAPEKVKQLVIKGSDPEMKHLPARLTTLVNLEKLEMSCLEKLEDLPADIGKLRRLEALIIDNGNGCAMNIAIPRSIGQLENLKVLTLYGALDPRDIGSEQPLRPAKIKRLPPTLANLRNLEELDLGRNGLRAVPPEIGSLQQLKRLGLDYNNIREIPSSVGGLKNLRELSLRSNGGVKLPQSLTALKGLEIHLGNNFLKLKDQQNLRRRFPRAVFFFNNEFDDEAANEQPAAPKPGARRVRKR